MWALGVAYIFFQQGGGAPVWGPCLRPEERQNIQSQIRAALVYWNAKNPPNRKRSVNLEWPLRPVPGLAYADYYGISNFVDHDQRYPDHLLDYQGGQRTYDTADGYNHAGTDIFLWPFPWMSADSGWVEVLAAAPGIIVLKSDGHDDHNCDFDPPDPQWNAVYIRHDDGSVAWYGHLKKGSLTAKAVGAHVSAGEPIGRVGSSGISTGPHLHLELYDANGKLNDPFSGPQNTWNAGWWAQQLPYTQPKLLYVGIHDIAPEFGCANEEVYHEKLVYQGGDGFYIANYFRDQLGDEPAQITVIQPDGSTYKSWQYASDKPFYPGSYWYFSFTLPRQAMAGTWQIQTQFSGQSLIRKIQVDRPALAGLRWIPHLTRPNAGFQTHLIASNEGDVAATLQILPYTADGVALPIREWTLQAGQFETLEASELLGSSLAGYLAIQAEPFVHVTAAYRVESDRIGGSAHVLETQQSGKRFAVYPGEWDTVFDGVALVNIGDEPAHIQFQTRNPQGGVGAAFLWKTVDPMVKQLAVFSDWFVADPSQRLEIISDQPLVLVLLRGSLGSDPAYLYQTQPIILE
ncbi:MAG: peptidoglycan DD-metalloendopeptidase family protein [Acidobacteria bacterium]|nr:peptidoglycan DD-metalloendopeptidase family protein [Acidobacteriota bacterium]MCB9397548.1 peptidoglycan DD-metalloendopeptidase family protein [Acidobacteriota bacterium]